MRDTTFSWQICRSRKRERRWRWVLKNHYRTSFVTLATAELKFQWRSDWWPVVPTIWSKRHNTTDDQVSKSLYRGRKQTGKKTRSSLSSDRKALISNNGNYQTENSKFNLLSKRKKVLRFQPYQRALFDVIDSARMTFSTRRPIARLDIIQLSVRGGENYACHVSYTTEKTFHDTSNYILKLIIFLSRWRTKRERGLV